LKQDQWDLLLEILDGREIRPLPAGFIIDSPWLPGWAGISTLDYFSSEASWLEANFRVGDEFPEVLFLPGFWAEYGMCTEPSAFGSKMIWSENDLPHADKILTDIGQIDVLAKPDVTKDGLLPFVIKRLSHAEAAIRDRRHALRFAVSRGPLNIASFLMGTTEFLVAVKTDPQKIHKLLGLISDFVVDWLEYQRKSFASIEGIFLLDDIVGFLGEADFREFAKPYLAAIYGRFVVPVKFFHNDAAGRICAPHLKDIGVNLFNFSFNHSFRDMRAWAGKTVTLLGNIPTRDVLAAGTEREIAAAVGSCLDGLDDTRRIILSCGGGMPPDVSTANLRAFLRAARSLRI
jgi:uroporphyrinogen decarboxylase